MTRYQHESLSRSLVVDDHLISRRYISEALRRFGWAVKHCRSTEEALPLCREWNPSLVIIDLNLPGADGFVLAEKLGHCTAVHARPGTLLLVSAQTSPKLERRARAAGFDGILSKPVEFNQLRNLLGDLAVCREQRVREDLQNAVKQPDPASHPDEDLLNLFRTELLDCLPKLETYLLSGRVSEAGTVIHRLTASAAICGNRTLETCLREFDAACRQPIDICRLARSFTRFHRSARAVVNLA